MFLDWGRKPWYLIAALLLFHMRQQQVQFIGQELRLTQSNLAEPIETLLRNVFKLPFIV